jgi:hypothetical protein
MTQNSPTGSSSSDSEKPAATPGWQDWVNRTTAVLAVLAALSSGRWGASNLQAILEQGKVNDTWSMFQAESEKEHSAEQMSQVVNVLGASEPADRTQKVTDLAKSLAAEAKTRNTQKEKVRRDAHHFEASRDRMVERGFWFEISFAALQLGVILSTIAAAAKSRGLLLTAVAIGSIGLVVLVNGFFFVVHAPKTWYQSTTQEMAYEAKSSAESK